MAWYAAVGVGKSSTLQQCWGIAEVRECRTLKVLVEHAVSKQYPTTFVLTPWVAIGQLGTLFPDNPVHGGELNVNACAFGLGNNVGFGTTSVLVPTFAGQVGELPSQCFLSGGVYFELGSADQPRHECGKRKVGRS
jgi:hypothetical protein